jgi:hypothetical protein
MYEYDEDELAKQDAYDLKRDCQMDMQREQRQERAMRIWRATYNVDQSAYYDAFLERQGIYKEFKEWLVDEINDDYPEDD